MPAIRQFGRLADGRRVEAVTLGSPAGLQAEVLTYGAILRRLSVPMGGQRRELVLALDTLEQYVHDTAYVGPLVGRFANRIAQGRFALDGQTCQLTRNEDGNHLHGGAAGVSRKVWQVRDASSDAMTLGLHSPDGEEGYPGNIDITLGLSVLPDTLRIDITARADAPTPVNLTWHPYFNLGGNATGHWLRIPASHYLPVGPGLIPTGAIAPVEGTPFDFRGGRIITPPPLHSHAQLSLGGGYDHCWVLDDTADCQCELRSPQGDVTLRMEGTARALQFYGGQYLSRTHPGIGSGLALEPQGLPDAPNHPAFPDSILRPGNVYRASIGYRVSVTPPGC
ncbi:MAG TPA: aldose epimerase family protein [Steroidobacteraceae bacterium]|nr:aldose epimerase family protein [Steroidobacteraceae bacterium]